MTFGCVGATIEVDLSRGTIEKRQAEPDLVDSYVAGKGTAARLLWDRVTPEVDAFAPESLLAIGAGVLTGTVIPGAGHTCISYKSPVTNIHCYSSVGGFFGAELKHAGYDTILFSGKSPTPVYLYINNDHVELRDASHLWGKSPAETRQLIREELENEDVQFLSIGPAGENRVYFASVEHGTGASASRGGAGAVMGDKKLKAIAVTGNKDIPLANASRLFEIGNYLLDRMNADRTKVVELSGYSYVRFLVNIGDFGNFSGVRSPELEAEIKALGRKAQEHITRTRTREVACNNCAMRCKHAYLNPQGGYTFMKCQDWFAPMTATYLLDCDFAVQWMALCEKYGLDTSTTANCVAFAIDMFKKGLLTKEDTGGLELEWKKPEVAFALIEKIAKRQDIGDVLANGTYRAARQIGKGAESFAHDTRKLDLPMYRNFHEHHFALMTALNEKGDPTMLDSSIALVMLRPKEERERYIQDGWFPYPRELEKYLMAGADAARNPDMEGNCRFSIYDMEQYTLADIAGVCRYWMQYWLYPAIASRSLVAELMSAVSGLEIDEERATRLAHRVINLIRGYNVREGIGRKDDFHSIPQHTFERVPPPPEKRLEPAEWNKMLDLVYNIRGWSKEGIPMRSTLAESGLDFVREDLAKRGIPVA
ncbi:MAG: hypothetical protein HY670_05620 [Chloroflexi bacterium]|nr:hypothetical protein [Chloroflexota bacterium]